MTAYIYNDGGRKAEHDARCKAQGFDTFADFNGRARDCVARSLAIISGRPYAEVWQRCADINAARGGLHTANKDIHTLDPAFKIYARELGLEWVQPVQGRFKDMQFPARCAVAMNKHYTAIIDGVINDTHNPTPAGLAHVYGWWQPVSMPAALYNVINVATGLKLNVAPLNKLAAETMRALMFNNYNKRTILKPHE